MPKMKTHKGTKKVLNLRNSGTVGIGHPGGNHNTGKKNTSFSRNKRSQSVLNKSDERRIKSLV